MARVIEHEVKAYAPKALTANAHMILRDLADSAGIEHRMVWIGTTTLATDARCDLTTVHAALRQLRDLNIIEDVPGDEVPTMARRYGTKVRRIKPVSEWFLNYDRSTGKDVAPGQPARENPTEPHGKIPSEGVGESHTNQELLTKNKNQKLEATSSLLRNPADSAKKFKPATDAELDPASAVGPYAEEAAEKSGPSGNPDSGNGLVAYFREALRSTEFGRRALMVPVSINHQILAAVLSRWIKDGTPAHLIRAWMDDYAASGVRTPGVPVWKSFLASRALLARATEEADGLALQDKIMNDPSSPEFLAYWGVSAEDVAPLAES